MTRYATVALVVALVALSGCADPNPYQAAGGPGFWSGIWDGFTAVFAFVGNLFGADWEVYQYDNSGGWYDFGFLWGIGALFGGVGGATR